MVTMAHCLRVLIYEVNEFEHQLVEVREMPTEKKRRRACNSNVG